MVVFVKIRCAQYTRQIDQKQACVALVEIRIEDEPAVGNRDQPPGNDLQIDSQGLTAAAEPCSRASRHLVEMRQAGNWNLPRTRRKVAFNSARIAARGNRLID